VPEDDYLSLFDDGVTPTDVRDTPRPEHRNDASLPATADDPPPRALEAPIRSSFAVADHDSDTWRMFDGHEMSTSTPSDLLDCKFAASLLIVEGCHLVPQGDMSVAAPFTATQLEHLVNRATESGVRIRTVNNRRMPRAWAEADIGPWERRKEFQRDAEAWHRWLSANPRRLASCKTWPAPKGPDAVVTAMRAEIMPDVNMVRQWRQYPKADVSKRFSDRTLRAMLRIWRGSDGGKLRELLARFGCKFKAGRQWEILESTYVCDAYAIACDPRTGIPRDGLSAKRIRKICGLYAYGYPNVVRSDLRLHGRNLGRPTDVDRDFVRLVRFFNTDHPA
jgi:hypothetical protein